MSIITGGDRNTEGIGGSRPVTSTGAKGGGGEMGTVRGPALGTHRCVGGVECEWGSGLGRKPTGTFRSQLEGEGGSDRGRGKWGKGFVLDHDTTSGRVEEAEVEGRPETREGPGANGQKVKMEPSLFFWSGLYRQE